MCRRLLLFSLPSPLPADPLYRIRRNNRNSFDKLIHLCFLFFDSPPSLQSIKIEEIIEKFCIGSLKCMTATIPFSKNGNSLSTLFSESFRRARTFFYTPFFYPFFSRDGLLRAGLISSPYVSS